MSDAIVNELLGREPMQERPWKSALPFSQWKHSEDPAEKFVGVVRMAIDDAYRYYGRSGLMQSCMATISMARREYYHNVNWLGHRIH